MLQIVAMIMETPDDEPRLTGAEVGRRLSVSERTGLRLLTSAKAELDEREALALV
ncbi:hypothetical protein [Embleya sp. NPDC005575]|uniref:hypothetical protein n=1 Tax=Embleya sp. NPDC005575 TaxID=3156892 RepID=UPI0033AB7A92